MNSRSTIQQELKELSSFLPHDIEQPVFTVPNGYFENFAASVWQKLRSQHLQTPHDELTELSTMLAAIPKNNPYTVPENYFSGFTLAVPSLVREDELPEALQALGRQMPNTVPAGYFDGLADTVLAKVHKPTAKVVSFNRNHFMRIAAAAVVTGVIAISGLLFWGKGEPSLDPNQQSGEWVAKSLQNVSNQALDEFIMTTDIGYQASNTPNGKTNDVKHMLEGVSNSELDAFLDGIPAGNEETLIN